MSQPERTLLNLFLMGINPRPLSIKFGSAVLADVRKECVYLNFGSSVEIVFVLDDVD